MRYLIGFFLSVMVASGAWAGSERPEEYGYFGVHATQHYFDTNGDVNNPDIEDTFLPGVQLGYRFASDWSLQGWYEQDEFDNEGNDRGGDLERGLLSVRRHFRESTFVGFEPYAGLSVGHQEFSPDRGASEDETMAGIELGLQRGLTDHWLVDVGARQESSLGNEREDAQAYLAVNYRFGVSGADAQTSHDERHSGAVRDERDSVKDSDGDGVADAMDECPETAANVNVDASGCERINDADNDGVADNNDECPDTASGVDVDASGCVPDDDNDGVADAADECPDTAAGARVDEQGCHVTLKKEVNKTLNVQFESGKADVKESSIPEIEEVAQALREYPESQLTLEGYTDNVGSAEANRDLSRRRAEAVKEVLVERMEIAEGRIGAVGHGENNPVADNSTASGRAQNRRVEATLEASKKIEKSTE